MRFSLCFGNQALIRRESAMRNCHRRGIGRFERNRTARALGRAPAAGTMFRPTKHFQAPNSRYVRTNEIHALSRQEIFSLATEGIGGEETRPGASKGISAAGGVSLYDGFLRVEMKLNVRQGFQKAFLAWPPGQFSYRPR
jgi:hypothetical protein